MLETMFSVSTNQIFPRVFVPAFDVMGLSILSQIQAGRQTQISSNADTDNAMGGTLSFGKWVHAYASLSTFSGQANFCNFAAKSLVDPEFLLRV